MLYDKRIGTIEKRCIHITKQKQNLPTNVSNDSQKCKTVAKVNSNHIKCKKYTRIIHYYNRKSTQGQGEKEKNGTLFCKAWTDGL